MDLSQDRKRNDGMDSDINTVQKQDDQQKRTEITRNEAIVA
jgi:hypothetical protein